MGELYETFFDGKKRGKRYQAEAEYRSDIYAFVDLCLAGIGMLLAQDASREDGRSGQAHMRELPVTMEQAYDTLLHRTIEPAADGRAYVREQLCSAARHIKERLMFTPQADRRFRMRLLCGRLSLSPLEQWLLCLGYAVTYDEKYAPIFADMQGGSGRTQPTFRLAFFMYGLFAETDEGVKAQEAHLIEQQGVFAECFLDIKESPDGRPEDCAFLCSRRTNAFLCGYDDLDKDVKRFASYQSAQAALPEIILRRELAEQTASAMEQFLRPQDTDGNVLHIYGPAGNGKKLFVQKAAQSCGCGVIFVDVGKIEGVTLEETELCTARLLQESILLHAVLCFVDGKSRGEPTGEEAARFPQALSYLLELLARKLSFFVWMSQEKCQYLLQYPLHLFCVEQPLFSAGERVVLWRAFSEPYGLEASVDVALCANQYLLSARGIQEALRTADFIRLQERAARIGRTHIRQAVRQQSPEQLGRFAAYIPSVYTWDDLVVDAEQKRRMQLICDQLKYRNIVGEEWGFYKKTAYGRGICALFYGAPGTGKTMAVQVMANELGLDLYRVDLSQMVSKYIGETEKNISELFRKAKNMNALLFFDEADSLFAKRLEVRDAHDRNANAETAHLLQKLEDYEGIAILATNYVNNIDDAFKRRIKFMVNFSFPTPEVRLKLWRTILPENVPCGEELDFEFYAERFELSGSSIKEILTNAAFMAAAQNERLANRHIKEAVKLNFSKYGKVLSEDDFGYLGDL